jgi:hypothetical protein
MRWLALFAVAMGWLEAVVVVYLRAILGIAHGEALPSTAEVMHRFAQSHLLLRIEQSREAATLIMLAAVGWLAAERFAGRLGGFLLVFGLWDISYYVALRILVGWPRSLFDMDLLFLLPTHPWWYQPVWVPVLISCGMIALGLRLLATDRSTGG